MMNHSSVCGSSAVMRSAADVVTSISDTRLPENSLSMPHAKVRAAEGMSEISSLIPSTVYSTVAGFSDVL